MRTCSAEWTSEPRDRAFDPFRCRSVGGFDATFSFCRDMGSGYDFDLLSHIVEDQHRISEQEGKVRKIERVLLPAAKSSNVRTMS